MPEPIALPPPKPSRPTKPKLTKAMLEGREPKPAGAGGWTPTSLQVHLLAALAAGAAAALDIANAPDVTAKALGIAFARSAVAYLVTYFVGKSAGVRKVSE